MPRSAWPSSLYTTASNACSRPSSTSLLSKATPRTASFRDEWRRSGGWTGHTSTHWARASIRSRSSASATARARSGEPALTTSPWMPAQSCCRFARTRSAHVRARGDSCPWRTAAGDTVTLVRASSGSRPSLPHPHSSVNLTGDTKPPAPVVVPALCWGDAGGPRAYAVQQGADEVVTMAERLVHGARGLGGIGAALSHLHRPVPHHAGGQHGCVCLGGGRCARTVCAHRMDDGLPFRRWAYRRVPRKVASALRHLYVVGMVSKWRVTPGTHQAQLGAEPPRRRCGVGGCRHRRRGAVMGHAQGTGHQARQQRRR
jgi:hypothetical protein